MELAGYQTRCVDDIYTALVDQGRQVVYFGGPKGCGKSYMALKLADMLAEDWKIFVIKGLGAGLKPYTTLAQNYEQGNDKFRMEKISLNLGFTASPLTEFDNFKVSSGINATFSRREPLLNGNERAVIEALNKHAPGYAHALIIADRYNSWDQQSKDMLATLAVLACGKELHFKSISFLLIDIKPEKTLMSCFDTATVTVENIELKDILYIVGTSLGKYDMDIAQLNSIMGYTGHDIGLIKMVANYEQESKTVQIIKSMNEFLDLRLSSFEGEDKLIVDKLMDVSIIDTMFSKHDAAPLVQEEARKAEKLLDKAASMMFVRKPHLDKYEFSDVGIRQYFRNKLASDNKYLNKSFSDYLQQAHPEDYSSRAHYLFCAEGVDEHKDFRVEAAYLLAIEYIRRMELTGNDAEAVDAVLRPRMKEYMAGVDGTIREIVESNIDALIEGYEKLSRSKYSQALAKLNTIITTYQIHPPFSTERLRLLLLAEMQNEENSSNIEDMANDLYNDITREEYCEDEQWCRAALVLMAVYNDRRVCNDKMKLLKDGFEYRVSMHISDAAFSALNNQYLRKSALFCKPEMAREHTRVCCEAYKRYSKFDLYLSLCNYAANCIICGDYAIAQQSLEHCLALEQENHSLPKVFKPQNNMIINAFLMSEGADYNEMNKDAIINAATTAANELDDLNNKNQDQEVNQVVDFNRLGMLLLTNQRKEAENILRDMQCDFKNMDMYYRFYFNNYMAAFCILNRDYPTAAMHLENMDHENVPMLKPLDRMLSYRKQLFRDIVEEQYAGDAFSLNYEFIKRGTSSRARRNEPSLRFWWRAFLLSDLQFLSL